IASNHGGGVRNHWKMTIEEGTLIRDNEATNDYGGLFNDGELVVKDSIIDGNEAGADGGGLYNGWHQSDRLSDGTPKMAELQRTQITNNTAAGSGAGIYSVRYLTVADSQ